MAIEICSDARAKAPLLSLLGFNEASIDGGEASSAGAMVYFFVTNSAKDE